MAVRAIAGADGRFKFSAPDMTVTDLDGLPTRRQCIVMATSDGNGSDWNGVRGRTRSGYILHPIDGTDVTLELAPEDVPLHGRFLAPDGSPLAGASVRLTELMIPRRNDLDAFLERESKAGVLACPPEEHTLYHPHLAPGLDTETRTDTGGRFMLSGLGRDRIATLVVSAPGVIETSLSMMTRDAPSVRTRIGVTGEPTGVIHGAGFTLKLKRGLTIAGVVIDADSRQPIPGLWVGRGNGYP